MLSRLPLAHLPINVEIVIGPAPVDLDRLFQVGDELPEE
jgi:hypothetical protein